MGKDTPELRQVTYPSAITEFLLPFLAGKPDLQGPTFYKSVHTKALCILYQKQAKICVTTAA